MIIYNICRKLITTHYIHHFTNQKHQGLRPSIICIKKTLCNNNQPSTIFSNAKLQSLFCQKKKLRSLFGGKSIESLVIFISTFSLEYCIFSIINMKSNELPLLKKEKILYNINKHKNMYFFFVVVCNYNQLSKI
jgi:hypothetical protein